MRVVEGKFGKGKEEAKASDLFQMLADSVDEMEGEGLHVETAVVMFVDGVHMQVAGNGRYPDGIYMLLQMGSETVMAETLGFGGSED